MDKNQFSTLIFFVLGILFFHSCSNNSNSKIKSENLYLPFDYLFFENGKDFKIKEVSYDIFPFYKNGTFDLTTQSIPISKNRNSILLIKIHSNIKTDKIPDLEYALYNQIFLKPNNKSAFLKNNSEKYLLTYPRNAYCDYDIKRTTANDTPLVNENTMILAYVFSDTNFLPCDFYIANYKIKIDGNNKAVIVDDKIDTSLYRNDLYPLLK